MNNCVYKVKKHFFYNELIVIVSAEINFKSIYVLPNTFKLKIKS